MSVPGDDRIKVAVARDHRDQLLISSLGSFLEPADQLLKRKIHQFWRHELSVAFEKVSELFIRLVRRRPQFEISYCVLNENRDCFLFFLAELPAAGVRRYQSRENAEKTSKRVGPRITDVPGHGYD